ncbi:MAG TPA: hypothetical protein VGJ04_08825 [Pirellulales bacterium]|jgi:hypothetical protein
MKDWPPFVPYLILALLCGAGSVLIVFLALMIMGANGGHITDNGMFGIAAMAAAPAIMGIGIAGFMSRHDR